jgi:hypothetical protein
MPEVPVRVFVAHSSIDRREVDRLVAVLKAKDMIVHRADELSGGTEFRPGIHRLLMNSHVLISYLTKDSLGSAWVNQEIGFAQALGIRQLPVTVGVLPPGMLEEVQAIRLGDEASDLETKVTGFDFESFVVPEPEMPPLTFEVVDGPLERTRRIGDYASQSGFGHGWIRQRGAFSSFSLPGAEDERNDPAIWARHDGYEARSPEYHQVQKKEREALEGHAQRRGVKLIIDPRTRLPSRGSLSVLTRLHVLRRFLDSMSDRTCRVVVSEFAREDNLLIVGDWLEARSQAPGPGGYRGTVFNRHLPSVRRSMLAFDRQFDDLLGKVDVSPERSRTRAIDEIDSVIRRLRAHPHTWLDKSRLRFGGLPGGG